VLWIRNALRIQTQNALSSYFGGACDLSLEPVAEYLVRAVDEFLQRRLPARRAEPAHFGERDPAPELDRWRSDFQRASMANPRDESRRSRADQPCVTGSGVLADDPFGRRIGHELKVHTAIMPCVACRCTEPSTRQSRGRRAPSAAGTCGPHCRDSPDVKSSLTTARPDDGWRAQRCAPRSPRSRRTPAGRCWTAGGALRRRGSRGAAHPWHARAGYCSRG